MKESCTDRGLERALIYSALGIRLSRRRKGSSETMAVVDNVHRGRVQLRPCRRAWKMFTPAMVIFHADQKGNYCVDIFKLYD